MAPEVGHHWQELAEPVINSHVIVSMLTSIQFYVCTMCGELRCWVKGSEPAWAPCYGTGDRAFEIALRGLDV